jgi:hypothetical protein
VDKRNRDEGDQRDSKRTIPFIHFIQFIPAEKGCAMDDRPHSTEEMIARMGELYKSDPEAFEAMRRLLIEETIEGFPEKHRARAYGLQMRIDAELGRYRDPVARMNRMVELFWEGFGEFQQALNDPAELLRRREQRKIDNQAAKVIPFPAKRTLQ